MIPTGGFWDSVGCLWLLRPWCWHTLEVGNSWILIFPQFYLFYLSSIWLSLVYTTMILNTIMHTRGKPGGGGEIACKATK